MHFALNNIIAHPSTPPTNPRLPALCSAVGRGLRRGQADEGICDQYLCVWCCACAVCCMWLRRCQSLGPLHLPRCSAHHHPASNPCFQQAGAHWCFGLPIALLLGFHFKLGVEGLYAGLIAGPLVQWAAYTWLVCRMDWVTEAAAAHARMLLLADSTSGAGI